MESILGVPIEWILTATVGLTFAIAAILVVGGLRKPLLLRLSWRNPGRRPVQASLICLGLTLSAIVVSTSLNTGDAVGYTVRSLVARGVGRTDEVVIALPRTQRRNVGEYLTALLNGTLLTGLGEPFPEDSARNLIERTSGDPNILAMTPAISDQVTVVDREAHSVLGAVSVLALPASYPREFGTLVSADGSVLPLGTSAVLNEAAVSQLGVEAGALLELKGRPWTIPVTVSGVAQKSDPAGALPTLYLELSEYQRLTNRAGLVNQVLVANLGDSSSSVRLSDAVARKLRVALINPPGASRVFELLRNSPAAGEIRTASRQVDGRQREKLERLAQSIERSEPDEEFLSLITDPELERRLAPLIARTGGVQGGGTGLLLDLSPLRVLEVKQASQDQADRWGGAITSIFLILGLFSLATGALLVFLIFMTLAAERRSELGVLRALGARRSDVILAFMLEGALYDLIASGAGVALGVAMGTVMLGVAEAALEQYGVTLEPHFEARSIGLAYALGILLTLVSIGFSAWRISQLSVVDAIRELSSTAPGSGRLRPFVTSALACFAGPLAIWLGQRNGIAVLQAGGVALSAIGASLVLRWMLRSRGFGTERSDRLAFSLCGVALLIYWLLPADLAATLLGRSAPSSVDSLFLAGLTTVLAGVWTVVYNLSLLTAPAVGMTARFRALGLAVRTAAANPLQHRLRTGLIVAMFAIVLFNMVIAGILLTASHRAYSDPEALSGGFDIRLESVAAEPQLDLQSELEAAAAVRPDDFSESARIASRPGQVIEIGDGARRWQPYALQEIDAGFAQGLRSPLAARANGYDSDRAVWQALLQQPGLAVVGGPAVGPRLSAQPRSSSFRLSSISLESGRFQPVSVWARDERSGATLELKIVGVLDPRVSFGTGLFASAPTLAAAAPPAPRQVVHLLKAAPERDPGSQVIGLNTSFADRGLRASTIGEEIRRIQTVRVLLNQLVQGFFGIGLLAGVAALGLVSFRAVVERRQQIGVLRALGFRRSLIRLSLLLEITLLAFLGIGLGLSLGLVFSQQIVSFLAGRFPEIVFAVPWDQLGLISLGAYLAALAMATAPLWQIGRIEPARALRFE